jgi:hypothetical protein
MNNLKPLIFTLALTMTGIVYATTLCHTVEFIDSGELAMAAKNMGIVHPTGYPLYTLLARIAAMIPLGSLIIRLNILSLLFTSIAVGFLYLLLSEFLSVIAGLSSRAMMGQLAALSAVLLIAFSPVWWSQGTTNEVYSLNLLLISIAIWALVKSMRPDKRRINYQYLAAFTLGLSLANHLSAVYLVPGFAYLIYLNIRNIKNKNRVALCTCLFFVFPASLYLFLPIRAHFRPFLNWGGVSDPYFLFKHITGWQYRIWMFDKPLEAFGKIGTAFKLLLGQFGWVGSVIAVIGIVFCAKRNRRLLIFAILIILLNLIYVLNYDIGDIESYYLPMILISSLFLIAGLFYLTEILGKFVKSHLALKIVFYIILIALPVYSLSSNYYVSNRSHKTFARQGAFDILNSMEPGGLAIVENWDFCSPWLYLHFEDKIATDKILLDKELMRRSWYIDFVHRKFPDLYNRSKAEIEEFLNQVEPFERARPFDPDVIDQAFYGMLHAIITHESVKAPVYTNIMNDNKFISGMVLIPDGILFRFGTAGQFLSRQRYNFDGSYWADNTVEKDMRVASLLSYYERAFESRAKYCVYFKNAEEAEYYQSLTQNVKNIIADIK